MSLSQIRQGAILVSSRKRYCYESYRENCTKIAAFEPFLSLQSLSSRFNDRVAVDMISTAK